MNYALTVYPLSKDFREGFERSLGGAPSYLHLSDLRKQAPLAMLRRLRGLNADRFILPLEDEGSRCILPVLTSVAGFATARKLEIVYPDFSCERVNRWSAVPQLARVALASASAQWHQKRCDHEVTRLLQAERMAMPRWSGRGVLYVNANLWFGLKAGGSVGHVAGVVNAMQAAGRDVTFASVTERTMIHEDVRSIDLVVPPVMGFPAELNYYRFQRMAARQMLRTGPPDGLSLIYQRMSVGNYLGVVLSRAWRVPLVMEYNGSEVWIAKNWGRELRSHALAARAEDVALKHAHVVVTISDVLRDELLERGVAPERIVCYPNCVDPSVFEPARFTAADRSALRHRLGLTDAMTVAAFVGTFGVWHGIEVLAQGIRQIIDDDEPWVRRMKLHFLLVGDGAKMPVVREILAGPKYAPYLTLTGLVPQAQAPAFINAADLLLMTHAPSADGSRFFGSPTKLFEYMAMGKGIVAPDLDQIGAVLERSLRTGALPEEEPSGAEPFLSVLFPPGDVPAFVEGVKFLAARHAWRDLLGRNARRRALARYTWTHHVQAILDGVERNHG